MDCGRRRFEPAPRTTYWVTLQRRRRQDCPLRSGCGRHVCAEAQIGVGVATGSAKIQGEDGNGNRVLEENGLSRSWWAARRLATARASC